ncbi:MULTISPECIES: energy transducer TonB [unclassified Novosphingobium]|uniref:energy transducer TonB n=1 Tax=unclassified Novosphingobium TaxID=2644732 RepID=UPI00086E9113|nr:MULTISPECIES: energy transducer TonB [unclassified Novosphingobium]MBN9146544.1 energy transducer TonB [Novosphingobium sp.]MDR6709314.1 hypothetical protein [Novosphingobium sp. 1748]ODU78951.1 MAG: hypothetical protein ABT10_21495 [Novosphingobium sp. SCN 63-17]OJX90883.1 MAG: hypothetical protein BGP00_04625 [Novosphingobium sp. 63-713]
MRAIVLVCLAVLMGRPVLAAQNAPTKTIELQRNGQWVLDADKQYCAIGARFGEGDQAITLQMYRYSLGDELEVRLISNRFHLNHLKNTISIGFGQGLDKADALGGSADGVPMMVAPNLRLVPAVAARGKVIQDVPPVTPEQEEAVTSILFSAPTGPWFRLATGSLKYPMLALRSCTVGLVNSWGYDSKEQAALKTAATPTVSPERWITFLDAPFRLLAKDSPVGSVLFRLDVTSEGKVADCTILTAIADERLRKATCDVLSRRATFYPARNAAGEPVRSFYINRVNWTNA